MLDHAFWSLSGHITTVSPPRFVGELQRGVGESALGGVVAPVDDPETLFAATHDMSQGSDL